MRSFEITAALAFTLMNAGALAALMQETTLGSNSQEDTQRGNTRFMPSTEDLYSTEDDNHNFLKRSSGVVNCQDFEYVNETTAGSPTVVDCQKLLHNIAHDGEWLVAFGTHQLVQYGTCAFAAHSHMPGAAKVGNGDIIRTVNQFISNYQRNGLAGGQGVMTCPVIASEASFGVVDFYLYHDGIPIEPKSDMGSPQVSVLSKKDDDTRNIQCWDDYYGPNQTAPDSPLVGDCDAMLGSIMAGDANWVIGWNQTWQLVSNGTCAYTVWNHNKGFARIGNGDIIRTVTYAQWNSHTAFADGQQRMKMHGWFTCNDIHAGGEDIMEWRVDVYDPSKGLLAGVDSSPLSLPDDSVQPASLPESDFVPTNVDKRAPAGITDCNDWKNCWIETSDTSPLALDCKQMIANIAGDGEWLVPDGLHQLIQYQTCAVGVHQRGPGIAKVGNQDLIDFVTRFLVTGVVGGKVNGRCDAWCHDTALTSCALEFDLYHNGIATFQNSTAVTWVPSR